MLVASILSPPKIVSVIFSYFSSVNSRLIYTTDCTTPLIAWPDLPDIRQISQSLQPAEAGVLFAAPPRPKPAIGIGDGASNFSYPSVARVRPRIARPRVRGCGRDSVCGPQWRRRQP